jgi:hypothetical protein
VQWEDREVQREDREVQREDREVQREDREVQREDLGGATGRNLGPVRGIRVMYLLMNHRV